MLDFCRNLPTTCGASTILIFDHVRVTVHPVSARPPCRRLLLPDRSTARHMSNIRWLDIAIGVRRVLGDVGDVGARRPPSRWSGRRRSVASGTGTAGIRKTCTCKERSKMITSCIQLSDNLFHATTVTRTDSFTFQRAVQPQFSIYTYKGKIMRIDYWRVVRRKQSRTRDTRHLAESYGA